MLKTMFMWFTSAQSLSSHHHWALALHVSSQRSTCVELPLFEKRFFSLHFFVFIEEVTRSTTSAYVRIHVTRKTFVLHLMRPANNSVYFRNYFPAEIYCPSAVLSWSGWITIRCSRAAFFIKVLISAYWVLTVKIALPVLLKLFCQPHHLLSRLFQFGPPQ